MTGNPHLLRALAIFGTQQAMADAIGIKQQTVSDVLRRGGPAPAKWCIPLELATGGQVTRHQLRSDLYPIDTDTSPNKHQAAE
jgi:DNA-binding transcriptional regulator YdaS (Cro superfamily)